MAIDDVIQQLRDDREFMRDVVEWQRAPAREARSAAWPAALDARTIAAFAARGIVEPYVHQAHAIAAVLNHEHTVVVASAAGGKSVCFHAPILDALLADPKARALCLFPTKSLAQDQLASLRAVIDPVVGTDPSSAVQTYDGDTPQGKRGEIRKDARALITNADMLHLGILPHHARWSAFFKNLRYVVIDEMHTYRGIFGSHVANVIRRLKRICAFYDARPEFILASATIANPREHAERLIELPVTLVDDDGSPHGEQNVVVVNPPVVDPEVGLRRSADFVVRDIGARLIDMGLQTICFARSRNTTEVLLTYLRDRTGNRLSAKSGAAAIAGYRGGYLAEERREIERGLRSGAVRGVVSTNALELGIDVGELDACVMHGYPGTIASFWQQAGRAGRRRQASLAVMVATADPLDQYLATHPQYLFEQSPEHARIAPDNLGVLSAHVACATFELPFESGERLGAADVTDVLDVLAEDGDIFTDGGAPLPLFKNTDGARGERRDAGAHTPARYTWVGETYPAERVSLRGIGERVNIYDEAGNLIGETDRGTAQLRVHVGAIYLHQAQTFLITELDWEAGKATARRVESEHYTLASAVNEVVVLDEFGASDRALRKPVAHGEIEVTSSVPRFRQVQFNTHQTVGWGEVSLPEQTLLTTGYWFAIAPELAERLAREGILALPNDYGPNWSAQRDAARERDGYRCMVCGKPESPAKQHHVHHRKPFRSFGYVRGENEHYKQANALDNLMTVCPTCHQRVETAENVNMAMSGLCNLIGTLAPLYVMCDRGDLLSTWDIASPHTRAPTITIYEQVPGGTGLADELVAHHDDLLRMAAARVRDCECERGCPSCIGPVDEKGERNAKKDVATILRALMGFDGGRQTADGRLLGDGGRSAPDGR